MSDDHSITMLLANMKDGDENAALKIWNRYFDRLTLFAERKLAAKVRRVTDGEDIAAEAFQCLIEGVQHDRFHRLDNRDDLWAMLTCIASRRAINAWERETREKRGSGLLRGESVFEAPGGQSSADGGIAAFVTDELTPDKEFLIEESCREKLAALQIDELLHRIAMLKLEGYSNAEIATLLAKSERTIERKLQRIRVIWSRDADDE